MSQAQASTKYKAKLPAMGFTLIELMITVAVLAILLTLALPSVVPQKSRQQVRESMELIEGYKTNIEQYYRLAGRFPKNNYEASIPEADKILGNYLQSMQLKKGVMTLTFGNKAIPALKAKKLSLIPIVVQGSPKSPISWVCGYDAIPDGMLAAGANETDLEQKYLPMECR